MRTPDSSVCKSQWLTRACTEELTRYKGQEGANGDGNGVRVKNGNGIGIENGDGKDDWDGDGAETATAVKMQERT